MTNEQLKEGLETEVEHKDTYNKTMAFYKKFNKMPRPEMFFGWIVNDHIKEDENYYEKLNKAGL